MKAVYCFVLLFAFSSALHAQVNPVLPAKIEKEFSTRGEIFFSFRKASGIEISRITRLVSIDNVKKDSVFAYANRKEFVNFLALHIPYKHLMHPGDDLTVMMYDLQRNMQPSIWDAYPTYTAYETQMAQFQTTHPEICKVDTLTTLVSGRRILIAKISSNVNVPANKPQFLYTSSIHGDELTGYVLMLRLIDYLLTNYGTNARVTNIVNNIELYINPLANPDGTYHSGNSTVNGATRYNANNVDLNRNYPDPDAGPHPDGNAWQPETIAWMAFANSHHVSLSANFHGGAQVVNYPWDTYIALHADDSWWQYVSREYADTVHANAVAGYLTDLDNGITNGYAWYTITGGRQDYMTYFNYDRECTIEISATKKPAGSALPGFWTYNWRSFLNYLEEANYGVRGIVTDSITGLPLHAKVFISGHDLDSTHVYSNLPVGNYHRLLYPGTYNITFSAPGYVTKTVNSIGVVNHMASIRNVPLRPLINPANLNGKLTYDNTAHTPLTNVNISLKNQAGVAVANTVTNSTGDYSFIDVAPGTYTFGISTTKPAGGYNSVDALAILKHFVQLQTLTGMKLIAADVDNDHTVNSIDALQVQKRFVGIINSFASGDWAFSNDTVVLVSGTNTHDLKGLCFGDVNASYNAP